MECRYAFYCRYDENVTDCYKQAESNGLLNLCRDDTDGSARAQWDDRIDSITAYESMNDHVAYHVRSIDEIHCCKINSAETLAAFYEIFMSLMNTSFTLEWRTTRRVDTLQVRWWRTRCWWLRLKLDFFIYLTIMVIWLRTKKNLVWRAKHNCKPFIGFNKMGRYYKLECN